jgi:hypothetical protein
MVRALPIGSQVPGFVLRESDFWFRDGERSGEGKRIPFGQVLINSRYVYLLDQLVPDAVFNATYDPGVS